MNARPEEIVSLLREEIEGYDNKTRRTEEGTVLEVGDGIATIYGLDRAVYGELVEFDTGVRGMVMDLSRDTVGCVLLGAETGLREGSTAPSTALVPFTPPSGAPSSTRPAASSPGSR